MNGMLRSLERLLEPLFDSLPPLSKNARDMIATLAPLLAVVLGVLQLFAAWSLWQLGHTTSELINYANELSQTYGSGETVGGLGFFYWLDLILLIAGAIILLFAFAGLRAHRKEGWELLFLAAVLHVAYAVAALFDLSHGGFIKCIGAVVASAASFYVLYQIRSHYTHRPAHREKHLPPPKK